MAQDILDRLQNCVTAFDSQADHAYGTLQPRRVVMLPLDLYEDLKKFLAKK